MIAALVGSCRIELYFFTSAMKKTFQDKKAGSHLPMNRRDMEARGWDFVDIVFVSGDAYVDHPSFAVGVLTRALEAAGFRVGRYKGQPRNKLLQVNP